MGPSALGLHEGLGADENLRLNQTANMVQTTWYTCSCTSQSKNELIDHLLQEVETTLLCILGIYETRRRMELNAAWRDVNRFACVQDRDKSVGGVEFDVSRK